jgi:putative oxidoreductase
MDRLFATTDSWAAFIARITLAVVMFPHGAQKLLGWFGGPGFGKTMAMFTTQMHIPAAIAVLVIVAESFGALGLFVGLFARVAAFGILCDMIGAVAMVHSRNGFFMNWMGNQAGEGFEYHILVIGIALAIIVEGAGRWSVDRAIGKKIARG